MTTAAVPIERAHPRDLGGPVLATCVVLMLLGLASFMMGLASNPDAAWRAFHVNYLFFGGLSQGAMVVACAFVIIGARWPGPVRRLAEGLGAWAPLTFVLFFIDYLGREAIYFPWLHTPPPGRETYLNPTRLLVMDSVILGVLAVLNVAFLYNSARPTLGALRDRSPMFARWTAGWRGDAEELAVCSARCRTLAPIICLAFAIGWTFIAFDQVMSLTPTWFSNLFGAYFCWGSFLNATAATALMMTLHRRSPGLEGQITKPRMHDIGKMIFAFSIFWMYLFFAQYLVIWYGNLPDETQFFYGRLGSQFLVDKSGINLLTLARTWDLGFFWERLREPYAKLTLLVWICCWVTPFWVLLGQRPKRTPAILGTVAAIVVFGFWLERNVLVWPSLVPADSFAFLGVVQVGVALGFAGAFGLVFAIYTRVFPSIAVARD